MRNFITRNTKLNQEIDITYPPKKVGFYFTRAQAAQTPAVATQAAMYDANVELEYDSDHEYDSDSNYGSDNDESDICSDTDSTLSSEDEGWDAWADSVTYGPLQQNSRPDLKIDLSLLSKKDDYLERINNYARVLKDIERAPERKALNETRKALSQELTGLAQLSTHLENSYRTQKAKDYNQSSMITSLFRSNKPTEDRINTITSIRSSIALVLSDLENLKVNSKAFSKDDKLMTIKYHIHHLSEGISIIKGAALEKFSDIEGSYQLQSSSNSALKTVLQNTFNCAKMPEADKQSAKMAFEKFHSKIDREVNFEEEASKENATAFTV